MAQPELSSALTYAQILAIYQNASGYDLEGSVETAQTFIKAGRMLLAVSLRRSGQASRAEEIEVEPEILERQTLAAVTWLASYNNAHAGPRQIIPAPCWRDE